MCTSVAQQQVKSRAGTEKARGFVSLSLNEWGNPAF